VSSKYEIKGVLIQEFAEPEIEKRYQDWFDAEHSHGVAATIAASAVWFFFAVNWLVAFHDQGDILYKVVVVHLTLSVWQFIDFLILVDFSNFSCSRLGGCASLAELSEQSEQLEQEVLDLQLEFSKVPAINATQQQKVHKLKLYEDSEEKKKQCDLVDSQIKTLEDQLARPVLQLKQRGHCIPALRRWQNYILYYTIVFEVFVVVEFVMIAEFTVDSADSKEHDGHIPEVHNPWLITALFILFLGFKAGFFHMKIRYYILAAMMDSAAFVVSYSMMAHLIHYKDVTTQVLLLVSVFVTGGITVWNNNNSAMTLFENFDKNQYLRQDLREETALLQTEEKNLARHHPKKQVMISYKHTDTPFAMKVAKAMHDKGYKVWIDIGYKKDVEHTVRVFTEDRNGRGDIEWKKGITNLWLSPNERKMRRAFYNLIKNQYNACNQEQPDGIEAGKDWRNCIGKAIAESDAVLFIGSPLAVSSKYCKEELYYASALKVPIFPLCYKDFFMDLKGGVKLILGRIQAVNFVDTIDDDKKFEDSMGKLLPKIEDKLQEMSKYEQMAARMATTMIRGDDIADVDVVSESRYKAGADGDGENDVLTGDDIQYDVFILVEATVGVDSQIGRILLTELEAKGISCRLIDDQMVKQKPNEFRDMADVFLTQCGCILFVQTPYALKERNGFSAEVIHCAYEANVSIIVLDMIERDDSMTHSMRMMTQMSPKVELLMANLVVQTKQEQLRDAIAWAIDPNTDLGVELIENLSLESAQAKAVMERVLFEVLNFKYIKVKEAEEEQMNKDVITSDPTGLVKMGDPQW